MFKYSTKWKDPCQGRGRPSLDVVVGVGSAARVEADEDAAAGEHEQAQEDVDQGGGPEGEQVERPVAVRIHVRRVFVVVGLVDRVDPHVAWETRKPRKTLITVSELDVHTYRL